MNIYLNDNASPGANLVPGFDQSSMVTSMSYGENMTAYLGDPRSWPAPNYTRQIIDFNNDNRVDIVSGFAGNAIGIWMNQGFPGTPFTHHDLFLPSEISDPHSVQVADLDSDGDLDLISTSNKNVVGIHLNTGVSFSSNLENSFKSIPVGREHPLYNQSNSGRAVAVALINNDSQLDIVVGKDAGTHSEPLVWFEGRVDNTAATVTHVTAVKLDGTYGLSLIHI